MPGKHGIQAAALALLLTLRPAGADVKPCALVSDNMVLQQGQSDPLWGTGSPGEEVRVTVNGQTQTTTAASDGRWRVTLAPMRAGGPYDMTLTGKNTVAIHNVLVGEVWVCSGQSNMGLPLSEVNGGPEAIAAARDPQIVLFHVPRVLSETPLPDVNHNWQADTGDVAGATSAAAFFFARELRQTLHVPIGLIEADWGATPAEAWTSHAALAAHPELSGLLTQYAQAIASYPAVLKAYQDALPAAQAAYDAAKARYDADAAQAKAAGTPPPAAPSPPVPPRAPQKSSSSPSLLFNGMIAPLQPYGIKGVIWYQGESNADHAFQYRALFPALIADWRQGWGEGNFPFLYVQLAAQGRPAAAPGEDNWAELREAQLQTLSVTNTAMAVAIDIGGRDIHPKDKADVGHRLALAALGLAYKQAVVYTGPLFSGMTVTGSTARLTFTHADGGLVAKGGALSGFAVAGDDRKWVWADAVIDGNAVHVSAKEVAHPAAVRYGWAHFPACNLYNGAGLPASPFRTDNWPGITQHAH